MEKQELRKEFLKKRKKFSIDNVVHLSKKINSNLKILKEYVNANSILFYVSFGNEVDTHELIKKAILDGKKVYVPKMNGEDIEVHLLKDFSTLKENKLGILEPNGSEAIKSIDEINIIIIPGVAFDKKGNRIGFGKSNYDRFLKNIEVKKIGLAYDFQVVENIEIEEHDIPIDILITESKLYNFDRIINGSKLSNWNLKKLEKEIRILDRKPTLAVVLIGENPASKIYVNIKKKRCEQVGINSRIYKSDKEISQEDVISIIEDLNNDKTVNGILVQLPIPNHLDENEIINTILPDKDVDCLTQINSGKLFSGKSFVEPCTPKGIIKLIESTGTSISGKNAVVIGRSNIVGKPISLMLLNNNATVTTCHSKTLDMKEITKNADILIVAIGKPKFVTKDMIKKDVIIIDVGINRVEDKIFGDVDFENVKDKCSFITPVPRGVG
ncbi:5-formyltetrahydrofolate cyclo-ligase, partial [archaeon]|nr:5-formyltetrahydrofolate cyclo-ligase [archaeon]